VPIVIERRRAAHGQAPLEVSHANIEGGN